MKKSDFYFDLPEQLIAQYPLVHRSESRLMYLPKNTDEIVHLKFHQLIDLLKPNDLLVLNNSRVMKARLYGYKFSGGKVEILVERIIGKQRAIGQMRASKLPKIGSRIQLISNSQQEVFLEISNKKDDTFEFYFDTEKNILDILESFGHVPLPPYMHREDENIDSERYQTVYAKESGSIAAPTAGLHFDQTLMEKIKEKNIEIAYVTLHVGRGTFQPVRVNNITEHKMHFEYLEVNESVCEKIKKTKLHQGRIIAVGTTSVRSLETASQNGIIAPYYGETNLFIYPGYPFQCVDAMVTNFHMPESTLLMLVCAFAGYQRIMSAYQLAIQDNYRFFSYGDAMFLER